MSRVRAARWHRGVPAGRCPHAVTHTVTHAEATAGGRPSPGTCQPSGKLQGRELAAGADQSPWCPERRAGGRSSAPEESLAFGTQAEGLRGHPRGRRQAGRVRAARQSRGRRAGSRCAARRPQAPCASADKPKRWRCPGRASAPAGQARCQRQVASGTRVLAQPPALHGPFPAFLALMTLENVTPEPHRKWPLHPTRVLRTLTRDASQQPGFQ